ncbi:ankyrin repeat domain-containing protein [Wolbachia endosymbiont (group B) of Ischnura elegans]|uniref:ankyrin repeat domain-containing protein n=1 Tax=Wolbachia endosymbiont (group B) of Ischnura elegans TaxID=2954021 RepID=UPI00223164E9|nr:ankyrin repeat domain-containing protein [Wolbachia endosymbiont (group B) of Ischnura elegans]
MNSEELQKILAENKKKGSLLKELSSAVTKNDLEKVKSIFEGNSPIIKDVVAEVNSANSTNLLGYAVDSEMAKYLIEKGISFSAAVTKAVQSRDLESVKSICQMNSLIGKDELQQNSKPLESATYDHKFNDKIARYLIEQGANPNATDHLGRYLLHLQIAQGNLKGAKALIENVADVNIVNQEEDGYWMSSIDSGALKGQTALFFAIRAYKKNINTAENTILNPEKANEALGFISYLIEKKANSNIKDCNEKTPLDTAIFFDTPEIVELLIKAGANLNVGREKAEGVLNYAVTKGHTDIGKAAIRYILEHNSRSNKLDLLNNQEELSVYWDEYKAQVNASEDFCPRKLAVISVAAISCALALYFLAPLIIGSSAGIGTQLALGAVGAVVGGGIGILTNVAIDQCYVNSATQQAD